MAQFKHVLQLNIEENYEALALAIVKQAVDDYRKSPQGSYLRRDVIRFLRSEWFTTLTNIDGSVIEKELYELYGKD